MTSPASTPSTPSTSPASPSDFDDLRADADRIAERVVLAAGLAQGPRQCAADGYCRGYLAAVWDARSAGVRAWYARAAGILPPSDFCVGGLVPPISAAPPTDSEAAQPDEVCGRAAVALDGEGVPREICPDPGRPPRRLDLVDRILWLALQRDALQVAVEDAGGALDEAGVPDVVDPTCDRVTVAGRIRRLAHMRDDRELAREREAREANRLAGEVREVRRRLDRVDEALAAAGVPMDGLMTDQGLTWFQRELEATRRQAAGAAADLDRERRAHQEAMDEAAATELRLTQERDQLRERGQVRARTGAELCAMLHEDSPGAWRDASSSERDAWNRLAARLSGAAGGS